MELITVEEVGGTDSPLLNKTEEVIFPLSAEDKLIVATLKQRAYELGGVGLAAPQIGQRKNIAVVYIPENSAQLRDNAEPYPLHVIINATYKAIEEHGQCEDFEGCYSVKSIYGKIKRYNSISVAFQDEDGRPFQYQVSGFYARVLQHEIDHLNGLLLTHRLEEGSVFGLPNEMIELRRKELSPEKRKMFDELLGKQKKN